MADSTQTYKQAYKDICALMGLAVCLGAASVEAEVYQWRDENGKIHFSDTKPKQQQAKDISHTVEQVNVDESSAERAKLQQLFKPETEEEKAMKREKAARKARQKAERKKQCAKAREELRILRGPVYFVRDDGSTYDISKAEQARRVADYESQIRKHCG